MAVQRRLFPNDPAAAPIQRVFVASFDPASTCAQLVRLLDRLRAAIPVLDVVEMADLFEFTTVRTQQCR